MPHYTHTHLHILRGEGHLIASLDLPGEAANATQSWFQTYIPTPAPR